MNKMRIISTVLMIFVWLVTAAFQPLPITPAAVDAPANFTKVGPAFGITVSSTDVLLQWNPSSTPGVTYQYCVRANKSGCANEKKWVTAGSNTSFPVQGLTPGITYYWQVRATDASGTTEADSGAWWWFTVQSNANLPSAFAKLTPTDTSVSVPVTGLVISWGTSANADRYEYCYDTINNNLCDGAWTNAGTATTATLPPLIYYKVYYWQVRAVNSFGNVQADSGTWWWFWTQTAPPGAFSKLSPSDGALDQLTSLTLSWQNAGAGATYQYCLDAAFGSSCTNDSAWIGTGSVTSANLTGLTYNTTYTWQVRATNGGTVTQADGGLFWSFTTRVAPPAAFGKTSPGDGSAGQPLAPTLTWEASAGTGVTYEYCYSKAKTAENACDGTWYPVGAETSASPSGLSSETLYYWQVRARNASGYTYANGSADALWSFTTQISAPWGFDKLSPTIGTAGVPLSVILEWSSSDGAEEYFYCVSFSEACDNTANSTNWISVGMATEVSPAFFLTTGKTYYWQVKAVNSQGDTYANGGVWWNFATIANPPSPLSKISPMDSAINQPLSPWLFWSKSLDAASYEYCIIASATPPLACDTGWMPVVPNPSPDELYPSINVAGPLTHNTKYYWQVRAINGGTTEANQGVWWSFTTLMNPPVVDDVANQAFQTNEDAPLSASLVATSNYGKTFTLVGSLPAGTLDFHSDGAFNYTPVANFNGQVSFQFTVSDGYNPPTPPHTATITVNPVGDPPMLQTISNLTVVSTNLVTFTAVATDADTPYGDTLSYSILEVLPQGATFNPATGVFRWFPKWQLAPATNVYTFTVVVTDTDLPTHNSVQQVVQITVLPQPIWLPVIFR